MKFSFGICTRDTKSVSLKNTIESINEVMPEGSFDINWCYDEDKSLTQKKNELVCDAIHENVVLLHDYFTFKKGWYESWSDFPTWDVASCQQLLLNGQRHFTDWVTYDDPLYGRYHALNYDNWDRTKTQYISGGFFLVKKQFMMYNLLDEDLNWGDAEDVEWSLRIRGKADIKCNKNAVVQHNKSHRDNY